MGTLKENDRMLKWPVALLVIAELLGLIGFGGLTAGAGAEIARLLFWVFFVLFVFTLAFPRKRSA